MNAIFIEVAAVLVAASAAAPFIINIRSKSITTATSIKSIRPQFDDDDMRELPPIVSRKTQEIKEKKPLFNFKKKKTETIIVEKTDLDDLTKPIEEITLQPQKTQQKKAGFSLFGIGQKKKSQNTSVDTGLDNEWIEDTDVGKTSEKLPIQIEKAQKPKEDQLEKQHHDDDDDEIILLSEPVIQSVEIEKIVIPEKTIEKHKLDDEDDLTVSIPVLKDIQIDKDEEDTGFNFNRTKDEEERRRWIEEIAEEERNNTHIIDNEDSDETADYEKNKSQDEYFSQKTDTKFSLKNDELSKNESEILRSYRWTTFMGDDAQSLGVAERSNLIMLLRTMKDPSHLDILISALQEEERDGLRPKVLEAIIHSYHDPSLAEIYDYCIEFGNDEEKVMAKNALEKISRV